ncbi:hypothetical protein ACIQUM_12415 [Amycolatopsis azurea]|uniref:hypothetical protein n=1 Tax=Amycolatopsis azurea TaxID=36819 RepID=UPI003829D39A
MSDLQWDEVKSFFDLELMGVLPDVVVPNASAKDWQTVFDLVKARGWQWEFRQADTTPPLPSAAEALARLEDGEVGELHVFPDPGMLVIFRLMSAEEIDFDVDLRELQGQAGVDRLCGFLAEIGRKLGKRVLMLPEGGSQARPILGFDPAVDRVVLLADPRR